MAGPYIESRFFPVVSKLSVDRVTSDPAGSRVETATFTKSRDCELVGLVWFHQMKDNTLVRVPVIPINVEGDRTVFPTRPIGRHSIGPMLVGLPLHDLVYHSFARVHHRCHWFWLTTTDFYP